jgi:hypothetical protein
MNANKTFLFEPSKVGRRIGSGADRVVYAYGDAHVVKYSSFAWLGGQRVKEKFARDYQTCLKYFGDFVVPVTVVSLPASRRLIEIQPLLRGVPLLRAHLDRPGVYAQAKKIHQGLIEMQLDGFAPVDLIGRSGWVRECIENVWIDEQDKLHIIDTVLLETQSAGLAGWLLAAFMPISRARQKHIFQKWLSCSKNV